MANITSITQNGKILATLQENQTVLLHTDDRKITGDIVIYFASGGQIIYRGASTYIEAGKTATIKCQGLIVTEDIIIRTSDEIYIPKLKTPFILLTGEDDIPEIPEEPEIPDIPDVPDIPEDPDEPDNPDGPDNPEEPDVPETPDTPEVEYNPTAKLGEAILGYLVLGDVEIPVDPSAPKLATPVIYVFTTDSGEEPDDGEDEGGTDSPEITKLDTPFITLVIEEEGGETPEEPEQPGNPEEPEEPDEPGEPEEPDEPEVPDSKEQLSTPYITLYDTSVPDDSETIELSSVLGEARLGYLILSTSQDPETKEQLLTPVIYLFEDLEIEQLSTPYVQLVTVDTEEPEEPETQQLAAPIIKLVSIEPEATTLSTPVIKIVEISDIPEEPDVPDEPEDPVLEKLDTPVIELIGDPEEPEAPEEPVEKLETPVIDIVEILPFTPTLDTPVISITADNALDKPYIYLWDSEDASYETEPNEQGTTVILNSYTEEPNENGITIIIT